MKALFKAIRNGDLNEVERILHNYPEVINEPAKAPPKKDDGLSSLQVALKIGEFDIAQYLIEQGADVNYIDPVDPNKKYVWRVPVIQDAIGAIFFAYQDIKPNTEAAEKATAIVVDMLKRGADPNAISWKTIETWDNCTLREDVNAIGAAIWKADEVMSRYPKGAKLAEEKLIYLLDLLLEHGADIEAWANRPAGAYRPDETNRKIFIDDFVPVPDETITFVYKGTNRNPSYKVEGDTLVELKKGERKEVITIKGNEDNCAEIRAFMQEFCKKRGLLGLE